MTTGAQDRLADWLAESGGVGLELTDGLTPAPAFDPLKAAGASRRRVVLRDPPPEVERGTPSAAELPWLSAAATAASVRSGRLDPVFLRDAALARIRAGGARFGAFVRVCEEYVDPRRTGALAGVPVGLKDLIDVAGLPTTAGANGFAGGPATRDAHCWQRLRDAGAVLVGKLNTQEFAAGVLGDNDHFGPVINPWHPDHVAGGSSSGSAAAVAAGLVALALGTDTGGSVRIPAACCGIVGLKPTYGRVPLDGVVPLAWSLDHVGVLARSVADAGLALDAMAGGSCHAAARAGQVHDLAGIRVGVVPEWSDRAATPVAAALDRCQRLLQERGAELVAVTAPVSSLDHTVAVNRVIAYAEGSAAHAALLSRGFGYGPAVGSRMTVGRTVSATDYLTAQRSRHAVCRAFGDAFGEIDVLLTPTLPCTAPRRGDDAVRIGDADVPLGSAMIRFTAMANLTGQPALSVPIELADDGLPVAVSVIGPVGEDELACFVGSAVESAVGSLRPPG